MSIKTHTYNSQPSRKSKLNTLLLYGMIMGMIALIWSVYFLFTKYDKNTTILQYQARHKGLLILAEDSIISSKESMGTVGLNILENVLVNTSNKSKNKITKGKLQRSIDNSKELVGYGNLVIFFKTNPVFVSGELEPYFTEEKKGYSFSSDQVKTISVDIIKELKSKKDSFTLSKVVKIDGQKFLITGGYYDIMPSKVTVFLYANVEKILNVYGFYTRKKISLVFAFVLSSIFVFFGALLARGMADRTNAEAARESSENQLRIIADASPAFIAYVTINDLCYKYVNKRFVEGFGLTKEQFYGKPIREVIGESNYEFALKHIEEVRNGNSSTYENHFNTAEGEKYVQVNYVPDFNDDGTVNGIVVMSHDITESKVAAEALRNAMNLSVEYINSLPGLFYVFDTERFVKWNSTWNEITGYSDEELTTMYGTDFFEGDDKTLIGDRMLKVFQEGTADAEAELVTKDGRKIPYYFTGIRKNFDGKDHLVGLGIDISERRKIEEELENHKNKLEKLVRERTQELEKATEQLVHSQKMEAIGLLAGGMAHEFNNIIATISGTAEMLLRTLSPDQKEHIKAKRILKSSNRAKSLTTKLLTFARKEKLNIAAVNVNELVIEVIDVLKSTISKMIKIETVLRDQTGNISVDSNQITQAFLNICLNACDAMPGGGVLTIETQLVDIIGVPDETGDAVSKRFCSITISDSGTGIEPDVADKIFNPFFTTKEAGKGTGLGLSVSHGIIGAHNGTIELSKTGANGTSFRILLPTTDSHEKPEDTNEIKNPSPSITGTILIIDDDSAFLEMTREALEMEGFDVIATKSGAKGIKEYKENKNGIDVVMLDLMMPEMDGSEVFHRLIEIDPSIKIVLCSGYSVDGTATALMGKGACSYIQKPFSLSGLMEVFNKILQSK